MTTQITSAQDMFDTIVTHLKTQGCPALQYNPKGRGRCMYRANGGLKCAIGALIPDESYEPKMEGLNVYDLCDNFASMRELFWSNARMLGLLQNVHDRPESWDANGLTEHAVAKLKEIASFYRLEYRA